MKYKLNLHLERRQLLTWILLVSLSFGGGVLMQRQRSYDQAKEALADVCCIQLRRLYQRASSDIDVDAGDVPSEEEYNNLLQAMTELTVYYEYVKDDIPDGDVKIYLKNLPKAVLRRSYTELSAADWAQIIWALRPCVSTARDFEAMMDSMSESLVSGKVIADLVNGGFFDAV